MLGIILEFLSDSGTLEYHVIIQGGRGYQMLTIDYGGGLANNYVIKYDLSKW